MVAGMVENMDIEKSFFRSVQAMVEDMVADMVEDMENVNNSLEVCKTWLRKCLRMC